MPEPLPDLSPPLDESDEVMVILPITDRWAALFEEERNDLRSRHSRRTQAYASARVAAHLAMRANGMNRQPVVRRQDGAPSWPGGVRGSLTHSRTLAAACISSMSRSVGIDIEQLGRLSAAAAERVLHPQEREADAEHCNPLDQATLRFSAKEAVYKAIYPLAERYIGYQAVTVTFDGPCFRARYVGDDVANEAINRGRGRYWRLGDCVLTKFTIEVDSCRPS